MTSNTNPPSKMENQSDNDHEANLSVEESTSASTTDIPEFGWSAYAERINGRFAMIGFTSILLIEAISNTSFLDWAGILPIK